MRNTIIYLLISILFFSCNGQESKKGLIDTKFTLDKKYTDKDKYFYKSKALDGLFNLKEKIYFEGDGVGTVQKDYHFKMIGVFENENKRDKSYLLLFDNNDILRDSLLLKDEDVSLDVLFANNKQGIALGMMDIEKAYYKISDLYEINKKTFKLKKIDLLTRIETCSIPIEYLTEEYASLDLFFSFGIKDKEIIPNDTSLDKFMKLNASSPELVMKRIFYKDKNHLKIDTKIGSFLKELRNEKGITQEQAAEKFGVTQRTVSRWETGNNMPDISMLVYLAEFYDVDVREIIDGERKSETMNEEVKETLGKVADYTEAMNARAMKKGVITMCIVFILLVMISTYKDLSPAPLVSMICAYNGATFIGKAKAGKDKTDLLTGIIFCVAMVINTVAFILK